MEDMDIDWVVDIPDTPDKSPARHINAGNFVGKESKLPVPGGVRNSDFMDEGFLNLPRAKGRLINENRHNRRLNIYPFRNSSNINKFEKSSSSIAFSPLENPHASHNASLFRRTAVDKNSKHDAMNSFGSQHIDKGKLMCSKYPSKSSSFQEGRAGLDLAKENGSPQRLEMAFPRGKMEDHAPKEIREGQIGANGNSSQWPPNFPKMSGNSSKGKEKIGDVTDKVADSFMDCGKVIDLSSGSHYNNEEQISASHHSVVSPRINRQKRLVRNGCISPRNIEIRAKQLSERSQNCFKDVEPDHTVDFVPSAPCTTSLKDIVAGDNDRCRSKGIMIGPCSLYEHNRKIIHLSSSSATNHGEISGNHCPSGDAFGWKSTHNHSKKVDHWLPDSNGLHSRRNDDIRSVSEQDEIREPHHVANIFTKRQKKPESTSENHVESSGAISDNSEIVFLGSYGESSRSRSSRIQSQQHQRILDIDELPPEMRCSDSHGMDCSNNEDLYARARQLEADEILARELQEQLYNESPVLGGQEIDKNIAWVLQQEEDALRYSNQNYPTLQPRTSSNSHRQPQPRLLQNASNRRGTRTRVHNSSGVTQLRSRPLNRSRAAPSRGRTFRFPFDMDLDVRLDILEALEAAAGDLGDMETVRNISQFQRDFNENDYEMLLSLDENNHQQGASSGLINSLPLSTVQTDNFEEICAICLDTPTIGESIRHLPCLHKFHKACIDPWLNGRPTCPVCKSSIT